MTKEKFLSFAKDKGCTFVRLGPNKDGAFKNPNINGREWQTSDFPGQLSLNQAITEKHLGTVFHGILICADLDVKDGKDGVSFFNTRLEEIGLSHLRDTVKDNTPSGGKHCFYLRTGDKNFGCKNDTFKLTNGLEGFFSNVQCAYYDNLEGEEILEITDEEIEKLFNVKSSHYDTINSDFTGFEDTTPEMLEKESTRLGKMTEAEILKACTEIGNKKDRHPMIKFITCAQVWHTTKTDNEIISFVEKCNNNFIEPLPTKELTNYLKRNGAKDSGMIAFARSHTKEINSAKAAFNERHKNFFKVEAPFSIYNADQKAIQDRAQFRIHREQQPGNIITIPTEKPIQISLVKSWLMESPNVVHGVSYRPDLTAYSIIEEEGLKKINLFSGFIKPSEDGNCNLFLDFVHDIIACNDVKVYEWLVNWMARIIQYPTDRVHCYALALASPQGCGKNFFFETFGELLGENFGKIARMDDVLEFNSLLANKVLVYLDECTFAANTKENNRLKDLITGRTLTINTKCIPQYTIENFITIGSGTNNAFSAPVEDNDRRWCVLKLSREKMNDKKYFGKIYNQLENENGYSKLMHILLSHKIDWDALDDYPKTAAYTENMKLWLLKNKPVVLFLYETLIEGKEIEGEPFSDAGTIGEALEKYDGYVPSATFMTQFKAWTLSNGLEHASGKLVVPHLNELFNRDVNMLKRLEKGPDKPIRVYFLGKLDNVKEIISRVLREEV